MPRLSIRKLFLYVLAVASCLLLALNIHQRTIGLFNFHIPGSRSRLFGKHTDGKRIDPSGASGLRGLSENSVIRHEGNQRELNTIVASDNLLDSSDKIIPPPDQRPWYMREGEVRPSFEEGDQSIRDNRIFPEDYPNHDRIPEQLMYLPPKHAVPKNMDDVNAPLKKILLWNGIQSWGGLRAGRGAFLKGKVAFKYKMVHTTCLYWVILYFILISFQFYLEKCPVNSCVISSSRLDAQQADLVLFKDHFTRPTFSRPTNQLWMMYFLECPLHTQNIRQKNMFNWTSTYRSDSTLGKILYYCSTIINL